MHLLYRLLCLSGLLINYGGNDVFSGNEMIWHPIINVICTSKYATLHFITNEDKCLGKEYLFKMPLSDSLSGLEMSLIASRRFQTCYDLLF